MTPLLHPPTGAPSMPLRGPPSFFVLAPHIVFVVLALVVCGVPRRVCLLGRRHLLQPGGVGTTPGSIRLGGIVLGFCLTTCGSVMPLERRQVRRHNIHIFFESSLLLSSSTFRRCYVPSAIFWTRRGRRYRPFSPPPTE